MKLIKAIEVTSRCRRRDGYWVGEGEMLRGLRELSCLDLQKTVFAFFFPVPSFRAMLSPHNSSERKREGREKKRGESQTMINVILIEVNLWCKFCANGS